jgi:large repetitive protein
MSSRKLTVILVATGLAGCGHSLDGPSPAGPADGSGPVTSPAPPVVCVDQVTTEVTVVGQHFAPLVEQGLTDPRASMPRITLVPPSGDPVALNDPPNVPANTRVRWVSQREMRFDIDESLALLPATGGVGAESFAKYGIDVCNRDATGPCVSFPEALVTVAEPTVTAATPDIICTAEAPVQITLTGTGFLDLGGTLPTIDVTASADGTVALTVTADSVGGCSDDIGAPAPGVKVCTSLVFTVPKGDMGGLEPYAPGDPPAHYAVTVKNPLPTGAADPCVTPTPIGLTVVPPPAITTIVPDLVCDAEGDTTITLTGTGFLDVAGVTPTVNVGPDHSYPAVLDTSDTLVCTQVTGPTKGDVYICTKLTFVVPQDDLAQALYDVTVTNPTPPNCTSNSVNLQITDPPVITGIVPPTECAGNPTPPTELTVNGTGFLIVDGVQPTVTFAGNTLATSDVAPGGCTDLTGIVETVQTCTSLVIQHRGTPPGPALTAGSYDIVVTNPTPPGCASAPMAYVVAGPPTLTDVQPRDVCENMPLTDFTLTGTNLTSGTIVTFSDGVNSYAPDVQTPNVGQTQLAITFNNGLPQGTYDVTVSNGSGCDFTLFDIVIVHFNPFVFFVDPPVVYNGISTQATVYVTNINSGPLPDVSVGIRLTGTSDPLTMLDGPGGLGTPPVYVPNNKIQAVLATGQAPGDYDVVVTDFLGCVGMLVDGLTVTNTPGLTVSSIDPPFGWTNSDTAVTIDGAGFQATPRAYLNPTGGGSLASPVRSVAFVNGTQLTGVVSSGLAAGTYDLIVVNPKIGAAAPAVGVLTNAFTVTADPPPLVNNATPGAIVNAGGQAVTVSGSSFQVQGVTFTCRPPGCTNPGCEIAPTSVVVGASGASSIDLTVDAGNLAQGTLCVIRVTNIDGSYGDFSAVSVVNSSFNPTTFADGPNLNVARRAPAATAGRATRAARFIYVMGGDDGSAAGALDSVETGAVDAFGALPTGWQARDNLPVARTLAGAVTLGRFIYLVGGDDGGGAVDTVMRAEILDPLRAPEINDLDFIPPPTGTGTLGAGTWNYKVSAVFPPGDPNNPSGESLPSDVQPVTVPDLPGLEVVLYWTTVPGASAYRVYRSPAPNVATGSEEFLAEVTAPTTSFIDVGAATTTGQLTRHIGDLGQWSTVATMNSPREGAGVALAEDPATPGTFYLYAVGGQDAALAALGTYEYIDIVVDPGPGPTTGDQAVGAGFTTGADTLTPRWQLGLLAVDNARASRVTPPTTYVYALGGRATGGGAVISEINVEEVTAGGALSAIPTFPAWDGSDLPSTNRAGFGAVANHNHLFAFCGPNGAPGATADSGEICGAGQACAGGLPDPPDLVNFNSTGNIDLMSRFLPGTAVESATIFLVGGDSGAGATNTTESMPW